MKKLSIIMLTYNHEKYIAQAIESVISQKVNFDYELFICNDASTDGTDDICKAYAVRYPNIIRYVKHNKNLGLVGNEAYAMKNCEGMYTAYLEGDDFYHIDDTLQKRVDFLDSHPEYIAICGNIVVTDEEGNFDYSNFYSYPPKEEKIYTKEDILDGGQICHTSSLMWRNLREVLNPSQMEAYCNCKVHQDVKITVALGVKGDIFYSHQFLGCHRRVLTNDSWTAKFYKSDSSQMVWDNNNEIYSFLLSAFDINEFERYRLKQLKCAMGIFKKQLRRPFDKATRNQWKNVFPNKFFGGGTSLECSLYLGLSAMC